MGNWHCVTSDCAKVVYREYKPPSVRWRYSDTEPWQEIEGDDYTVKEEDDLNSESIYKVKIRSVYPQVFQSFGANGRCRLRTVDTINEPPTQVIPEVYGPILGWRHGNHLDPFPCTGNSYDGLSGETLQGGTTIDVLCYGAVKNIYGQTLGRLENPEWVSVYGGGQNFLEMGFENIKFEALNNDVLSECKFTIYKDGEIVYTETNNICPIVEVLQCHLSDEYKEIEIEKISYLERVEVVPYAYDVKFGLLIDSNNYGFLLQKGKIPDECLNIYKNNITSIIPNDFVTITNTPENGFNLITQICSIPGCPSPEFEVICDCSDSDCEECPDGTCAVECGDTICCYDQNANVVKSIHIEDYYCKSNGSNNTGSVSGETGTDVQDFINSFGENYKYPHPTQQG